MKIPLLICCLTLLFSGESIAQDKLLIAAASDLKFAMDSVISSFRQQHPAEISATYGSSGKLSEQIVSGAPFDIFFSADITYPERLQAQKKTSSEIFKYAKGRIVLWSFRVNPEELKEKSLKARSVKKIAVANPRHAPYGKRAIEFLKFYQLFDQLQPKLVYGDNISQAAQFITTGAADMGIIALSLALSPNLKNTKGKYYLIPEEAHEPLIQGAVITSHGKHNGLASEFFAYIQGEKAEDILKYFGFARP